MTNKDFSACVNYIHFIVVKYIKELLLLLFMKNQLMKETQTWVADKLRQSREFSLVDINYKFDNNLLNIQGKRQIYAEKANGERYLVIINTEPFRTTQEAEDKIRLFGSYDIFPLHIQYKGGPSNFFKWDRGIFKKSRKFHDQDERTRQIRTTDHERMLNDLLGDVVYFNPSEQRLEVIEFLDASKPNYDHVGDQIIRDKSRDYSYKEVKDHRIIESYPEFSLASYEKNSLKLAKPKSLSTLSSQLVCLAALQDAAKRNKQPAPYDFDTIGETIEERIAISQE